MKIQLCSFINKARNEVFESRSGRLRKETSDGCKVVVESSSIILPRTEQPYLYCTELSLMLSSVLLYSEFYSCSSILYCVQCWSLLYVLFSCSVHRLLTCHDSEFRVLARALVVVIRLAR